MGDDIRDASVAAAVERMTSRVVNSMVIAAGILALGIYWSGDDYEAPTYQVVATPDGRVIRVNTESGSVVSCDATRCTLVHLQGDELPRLREEGATSPAAQQPAAQQPALPAPAAAPPAGSAPQPQSAPQEPPDPQAPAQPHR